MYQTKHFKIEELVPPEVFKDLGVRCWQLFDERALITLDQLRGTFGPLTCNNWHSGGPFKYRGYRPPFVAEGSKYSQHRAGRAFDVSSNNYSAEEMRRKILAYPPDFPYLTCLEDDVTWLHFDVRGNVQPILIVKP